MILRIVFIISLITYSFTTTAGQQPVVRLHVTQGLFNISGPIGSGGESPIGPFTLESGVYQGDPLNPVSNHIVTWQFGFFGPVYNYTAAVNPQNSAEPGGPQPNGFVDNINNTIFMDMRSWFAYWNGVSFNQGSLNATGSYDPLSGAFTLNWSKEVIGGPFNGLTGYWQLHGFAEVADGPIIFHPTLAIEGGNLQECEAHGGTNVITHLNIIPDDGTFVVTEIQWFVDDLLVATGGETINSLIPLGRHTIRADVTLDNGQTGSANAIVQIEDTLQPDLDLSFIDSRSGETVTSITNNSVNWITANILATDVCDPNPVENGIAGFNVKHGDSLKIQGNNDAVQLTTDTIELKAIATDASNNSISRVSTLLITP